MIFKMISVARGALTPHRIAGNAQKSFDRLQDIFSEPTAMADYRVHCQNLISKKYPDRDTNGCMQLCYDTPYRVLNRSLVSPSASTDCQKNWTFFLEKLRAADPSMRVILLRIGKPKGQTGLEKILRVALPDLVDADFVKMLVSTLAAVRENTKEVSNERFKVMAYKNFAESLPQLNASDRYATTHGKRQSQNFLHSDSLPDYFALCDQNRSKISQILPATTLAIYHGHEKVQHTLYASIFSSFRKNPATSQGPQNLSILLQKAHNKGYSEVCFTLGEKQFSTSHALPENADDITTDFCIDLLASYTHEYKNLHPEAEIAEFRPKRIKTFTQEEIDALFAESGDETPFLGF